MSFFKRALASIGIGSAQVNAHLEKTAYQVGEEVRGVATVEGGNADQQIDNIYMYVMTQYSKEENDRKVKLNGVVGKFLVSAPFSLKAGETKEIPFAFVLPYETPVTQGRIPVWIETGLDIPSAVDPKDTDVVQVLPSTLQTVVLDAVNSLGFRLRKTDCEYSRVRHSHPFVQEFEFVPAGGPFRGHLDELEVVFLSGDADAVEVLLQVDKKARGLFGGLQESLGLDERYVRFTVTSELAHSGSLTAQIQNIIERNLR
ncbi:sporulation protein [Effusibacillus consociatus]|uniref:Sporulation protein n=1 Tax=Effusibacillus consociatus TaxID=1117041 RepID=A0ABV9PXJ8_9BACL